MQKYVKKIGLLRKKRKKCKIHDEIIHFLRTDDGIPVKIIHK